eukprot:NODE_1105_length_1239_cov_231.763514.p2 GENE.NODE_1105_length_1239_cov_231.763514~~NODE_1105_length_1239_cov_231.763514.p2  ORF type:complete len:272 (+),score=76.40 NODE_1105_length_1239_cov_231.763514:25-816(+)
MSSLRLVLRALMRGLSGPSRERSFLEARAQRFRWFGPGKPLRVLHHNAGGTYTRGLRGLFRCAIARIFALTTRRQHEHMAWVVGEMLSNLLAAGLQEIPPAALDFICVLPVALRRLDAGQCVSLYGLEDVTTEMRRVVDEARSLHSSLPVSKGTRGSLFERQTALDAFDDIPHMTSAEQLHRALVQLRSMRSAELRALFDTFSVVIAESTLPPAPPPTPPPPLDDREAGEAMLPPTPPPTPVPLGDKEAGEPPLPHEAEFDEV